MPDETLPAPPPPGEGVEIAFAVRPIVGPRAPTLQVRWKNPGTTPLRWARFQAPACFAAFYLHLELTRPDGTKAGPRSCAVRDWPGTDTELAPGATETVALPLEELFGPLGPGVHGLEVAWDTGALVKVRPELAMRATQWSLDGERFAIATPLTTFRIQRGATTQLPGGVRLTFAGHGHKRTYAGDESPLMIAGTLAVGAATHEVSVSLMLGERRWFQIDGRVFELVDHEYDRWMELAYYGSLSLE